MSNHCSMHIFGEVLFDHFPGGSRVLGGAPFNVAWHLQAFGLAPRFISRVGDDEPGWDIATAMDQWGMSRESLQSDDLHATGSVKVFIEHGEPHYEIVADCAYDFIAGEALDKQETGGILYHGSLALRNPASYTALQAIKARHRGKIFIDVNLRPPWWRAELLALLIADADWVKLNEAELAELCPGHSDLQAAMRAFHARFGLETLVVTRGAQGAAALDKRLGFTAIEPPENIQVVDTVGAGDAFAAVLLLGMAQQWPLAMALQRAQQFAAALVGRRGAIVTEREFYRVLTADWGLRPCDGCR